jgi:hypothetical protein
MHDKRMGRDMLVVRAQYNIRISYLFGLKNPQMATLFFENILLVVNSLRKKSLKNNIIFIFWGEVVITFMSIGYNFTSFLKFVNN